MDLKTFAPSQGDLVLWYGEIYRYAGVAGRNPHYAGGYGEREDIRYVLQDGPFGRIQVVDWDDLKSHQQVWTRKRPHGWFRPIKEPVRTYR